MELLNLFEGPAIVAFLPEDVWSDVFMKSDVSDAQFKLTSDFWYAQQSNIKSPCSVLAAGSSGNTGELCHRRRCDDVTY